ncbi:hypothetical protein LN650_18725 [Klebsiella pneumoniae subsp. pneumoniae]|nr:hypothetical protein [Klebsiella pneumoniae subsp. pneumoniae]
MDFNEERVDLARYYGATRYPGSLSTAADGGKFAPVCSPRYRQQYRPLSGGDPAALVWIHANPPTAYRINLRNGGLWCQHSGQALPLTAGIAVNNHSLAIEMALNGLPAW